MTDVGTPTLAAVIRRAMESELMELHTAFPGRIQTYDSATQTATIIPQFKQPIRDPNGNRQSETLPALPNVPIIFPRGGGCYVSLPMAPGDPVLCIVSEAALGQWRSTGEAADPGDDRRHSLAGVVAYPGLAPSADALADPGTDNVVIGAGGSKGVLLGDPAAAQALVLGGVLKTWLETHTHTVPVGGSSGPPVQVTTLPATLSSKHKVDV